MHDPSRLKWRDLVEPGTPLPTPWEKESYEKQSGESQARRRKLLAANAPQSEVDKLFREEEGWSTKLLGGMKFADVTDESGLKNPSWGSSAAFLDYDRDGWLDLAIVNYVNYDPNWPCRSRAGGEDYCDPAPFPGTIPRTLGTARRSAASAHHPGPAARTPRRSGRRRRRRANRLIGALETRAT